MQKKGISQETLKMIACITMLLDHIGAMFVRGYTLRIIGRIAFPIFCFLMAEGSFYTKNPSKYALRLLISLFLSELPFDLALKRGFTWQNQSVMVTLLLGFLALEYIKRADNDLQKLVVSGIAFYLAEWAHSDYGGYGVLLIIFFSQTRGRLWLQTLLVILFAVMMNSLKIPVLGFMIPIELFAVFAMIPIAFYSGEKRTSSKYVQWAFYSFYPLHLTILYLVRLLRIA